MRKNPGKLITEERLKELMHYDPNTGIFTWKVNRRRIKAGTKAGFVRDRLGYIAIRVDYKIYLAHRLAWLYSYGSWPLFVDHANRNTSDNRLCNLREATLSQNAHNKKRMSNNTSGFKGVRRHTYTGKWMARLTIQGKHMNLGTFDTKEEAARTYRAAAKKYVGIFCFKGDPCAS